MFIWFAAGSAAIVWAVFQSPAIDYRMVMVGSLLAVAEAPFGVGPLQTLAASVVLLGIVMVSTIGRRLVRRRWLGLPIGTFLHLVLDGSWSRTRVFWWPAAGFSFPRARSLIAARGIWSLVLELAGVLIALSLWGRFGLSDAARRRQFLTTGQLDRGFVRSDGS